MPPLTLLQCLHLLMLPHLLMISSGYHFPTAPPHHANSTHDQTSTVIKVAEITGPVQFRPTWDLQSSEDQRHPVILQKYNSTTTSRHFITIISFYTYTLTTIEQHNAATTHSLHLNQTCHPDCVNTSSQSWRWSPFTDCQS